MTPVTTYVSWRNLPLSPIIFTIDRALCTVLTWRMPSVDMACAGMTGKNHLVGTFATVATDKHLYDRCGKRGTMSPAQAFPASKRACCAGGKPQLVAWHRYTYALLPHAHIHCTTPACMPAARALQRADGTRHRSDSRRVCKRDDACGQ